MERGPVLAGEGRLWNETRDLACSPGLPSAREQFSRVGPVARALGNLLCHKGCPMPARAAAGFLWFGLALGCGLGGSPFVMRGPGWWGAPYGLGARILCCNFVTRGPGWWEPYGLGTRVLCCHSWDLLRWYVVAWLL